LVGTSVLVEPGRPGAVDVAGGRVDAAGVPEEGDAVRAAVGALVAPCPTVDVAAAEPELLTVGVAPAVVELVGVGSGAGPEQAATDSASAAAARTCKSLDFIKGDS
jgi:hypothetical protein